MENASGAGYNFEEWQTEFNNFLNDYPDGEEGVYKSARWYYEQVKDLSNIYYYLYILKQNNNREG